MENIWFQSALWMALALIAAIGSILVTISAALLRDCRRRYCGQHSWAAADALDQLHRRLRCDCSDVSRGHRN